MTHAIPPGAADRESGPGIQVNRALAEPFDLANPYHSAEIRGVAEIRPDENKRLPYELSHKYLGVDPPAEKEDETRVIIRIVPKKVVSFSA
jgi:hypothetical protein